MATTQYIRYPSNTGGGGGVSSINTLTGDVVLAPGTGISITPSGNTLTIATTGAAFTPGNLTDVGTDGITITGGTNAVNGAGTSIAQHVADATHNGYLSSTDWSTFNSKQPAGNYALTDLSNLVATSINQDLLPAVTATSNLGSLSKSWASLHIGFIQPSGSSSVTINVNAGYMTDLAGNLSIDYDGRNLQSISGAHQLTWSNTGVSLINQLDLGTHKIVNVVDPTSAQDAATKNYVDSAAFANKTLSNLTSPTAINQSLLLGAPSLDIGNTTQALRNLYAIGIKTASGTTILNIGTQVLIDSGGNAMLDFSTSANGIDVKTHKVINVVDPTNPQDAATKNYVDTHSGSAITALTGDVTATGPGSVAATLATVNGNVGSFGSSTSIPNFTVNAKGLITAAGGNVVIAPAGTLTGTTLASNVVTSSLTSLGTQSQALNMGSHLINAVTDPVSAQDAATKAYVDNVAAGINPAVAVQAATTSSANTSGFTYNNGVSGIGATFTGSVNTPVVIDGFTFTTLGQRLLVKNDTQSPSGAFNGVYYVTQVQTVLLAPILTRALDYDQPSDINNTGAIPVINGTVNGTTQWVLTSLVNTVGTDPLTFTLFARNPADYLLKANNLSDVASPSTSFNNISPMTTGGDIIYGGTSGAGTRLPNGSLNQVLTSQGGTSAPVWQSPGVGNAVATAVALTSSYTTAGAGAPIIYDTVIYDTSSSYSTITGLYTCPDTAKYKVSFISFSGNPNNTKIYINGVGFAFITRSPSGSAAGNSISVSCNAGDTIAISPDASDTYTGNVPYLNYLSIEQIH